MDWVCEKCETHNAHTESECEVCGHANPATRVKPAPAMVKGKLAKVEAPIREVEARKVAPAIPNLPVRFAKIAGVLLAALLAVRILLATRKPPAPQLQGTAAKGILSVRADAPNATLFYRKVGESKWRYTDCSPKARVALSPGRYEVRVEGVGGRVITGRREIAVLSGQQADVAPDG